MYDDIQLRENEIAKHLNNHHFIDTLESKFDLAKMNLKCSIAPPLKSVNQTYYIIEIYKTL
jgi:hypothetical protein